MKWEIKPEVERECASLEPEAKPTGFSKALGMLNPFTTTANTPNNLVHALSNVEKNAIEAFKLQVERNRATAIELARRNTIR